MENENKIYTGFKCRLGHINGVDDGIQVSFRPGYTALIGPNGAGKTNRIRQIYEVAENRNASVLLYTGPKNLDAVMANISDAAQKAIRENKSLFILLDGLDTGLSIDKLRDLMEFIGILEQNVGIMPGGAKHDIYIIAAINQYEMAKRVCIDIRTGKPVVFSNYSDYARHITGHAENLKQRQADNETGA